MTAPSGSSGHLEWEALVGRALLRFGDIEYVSIKCLEIIPKDKLLNSTSRMDFSRRADLLIEMLSARENLSHALGELLKGFKLAKDLAKTRNLIAHNPLMLNLYVNQDTQDSMAVYRIDSARSDHSISLDELKEYAAEVDDLAANMWTSLTELAGDAAQMWKEFTGVPES